MRPDIAVTWSPAGERWAWAEVDLDAVVHNVAVLRAAVSPAAVWAVVKADGYGHGAVEVARAALDAGAGGLCVALVQEAARLRAAGAAVFRVHDVTVNRDALAIADAMLVERPAP